MSAIMGPNLPASIIAEAHAERGLNWAQLSEEYRGYAFALHHFALGEVAAGHNDLGPIYVRQALAMQKRGVRMLL